MWYNPLDLDREFARLNRLAEGLLGDLGFGTIWTWPAAAWCCTPASDKTEEGQAEPRYVTPRVRGELNEAGDTLTLYADMPGVQKMDLELEATSTGLTVKARNEARAYKARVPLRYKVDPASAKATLKAGLLEVQLKLATPLREKATKIEVE